MQTSDIKKAGLKITLPRVQILEYFDKNPGCHFSADDLFTKMRDSNQEIALATIYRVLNQFEAAGLIIKHQFDLDQSVYEIDTGEHHDHMVDVETGEVKEFYSKRLEQLQVEMAELQGYELVDHNMVLYVRKKK